MYLTAALAGVAALGAGLYVRWASRTPTGGTLASVPRLTNTNEPADWTNIATVAASVPGHVHCFSVVDDKTIRLVWGSPRKAEDIEIDSGARRPASLVREAYSAGCPDLSPDRRELLFTANTAVGGAEIRRSMHADGRDSRPVTPGSEPVWLANGEEFAYGIDGTHVAVFSLPTMKFRLLADPGLGSLQSVLGKTVSNRGEAIAVMFYVNDLQWAVALYDGPGLDQRATFAIPGARNFRFAPNADRLFLAPLEPRAPLAALDLRKASYRHVGTYAGLDMIDAVVGGPTAVVLGRRRTKDAWLYDGSGRQRLTTNGDVAAATISPSKELLLARQGSGGSVSIWSLARDGALQRMTNGQFDTSPDFSPDGRSWIYVDYPRRSIMICPTGSDRCQVLRRDEILPTWPRFSPDGSKIAYVRNGAVSQMVVFSVSDGKQEWPVGATHWQCPPVWSSSNNVWVFEGSAGGYAWVEKTIETALRTGRRVQVTDTQSAVSDDLECWPRNVDATSPFFRKLRVETEETSSILRLPPSELAQ